MALKSHPDRLGVKVKRKTHRNPRPVRPGLRCQVFTAPDRSHVLLKLLRLPLPERDLIFARPVAISDRGRPHQQYKTHYDNNALHPVQLWLLHNIFS